MRQLFFYFNLGLLFVESPLPHPMLVDCCVRAGTIRCDSIVTPGSFHGDQAPPSNSSSDASSVALDALFSCLRFRADTVFPARRAGPSRRRLAVCDRRATSTPTPRPLTPGPRCAGRAGVVGRPPRPHGAGPPLGPPRQALRGLCGRARPLHWPSI